MDGLYVLYPTDDGMDWPGPRVFPGTGILFSLFVFLANVEALPRILDGR